MADADPQASSRIFISYRREDSSGHVLALLPALRRHFGADRIFKDTDNIPPGVDFVKFIRRELESCAVLLAIIGRDWLTVQDPRLKRRRLDNPDDFLRVEVASALKNDRIRVIPVLVERSTMPTAEDLPSDLAELPYRNALELNDARWESDVQLLIQAIQRACAAPEQPAAAAFQRPELLDLQKRRSREIAAHLAGAREALEGKDYEGTLLACEKALLLDPQGPEALELLDRARKAIDEQKIDAWLQEARQALSQSDIGNASELIDQALAVDPASERALTLRKEMLGLRRERERERERARAAQAATERARASLDEEDFEAAVRHADDALALEAQSADAQDIRSKALLALDERRRQRENKRRAQQTVADARGKFIKGEHEAALRLLREFTPAHELVSQALQELQKEADAIEAKARLAAATAAEGARRQADAKLAEASTRFQEQDYAAAQQLIEAARSHDSQHPEIAPWLRRVEAALSERAAAARRGEAVRTALAEARESFKKGELELAIRHADAALTIEPTLGDAQALRESARAALAEQRAGEERERLATQTIERARRIFTAKDYKAAIDLLAGFSPPHSRVSQALDGLREEFRGIEQRRRQQEEEAARRRREVEREAAERTRADTVRRILARGRANLDREDYPAAVRDADEVLGLDPQSGEAQALRSAATKALQQRIEREQQDRLAQQAAEKARAEAARAAEERRLAEAREREERDRVARQAAEKVRAEAARAAEEQRQADARAREREEAERQEKALATVISTIEGHLAAGELDQAEQLLTETQQSLPPSPAVAALRDRAKELRGQEALRVRQTRIQQALAEAESAFTAKAFKSAKRNAATVLELAPDNQAAQSILASATRELHAARLEFWSIRRAGGLVAAAVVLSTAIGIWFYGQTSGPTSQPEGSEVSSGTASPPPAKPSSGAQDPVRDPSPPPESAAPPVEAPTPGPKVPTPEEANQQRLVVLRDRARGQLRTGQRAQALDTAAQGLLIEPKDPALQSVLDSLLGDAQKGALRAKSAARTAGAAALPQPAFAEGLKLEDAATRLLGENEQGPAIRSFWKAEERFDHSARQAKAQAAEQARLKELADDRAKQKAIADEQARQQQLADEKARQKPPGTPQTGPKPTGGTPAGVPEEKKTAENRPPAGPEKPPAAEPAKPAAIRMAEEQERVKTTLQRYEAAYDNLNAAAVRAVFPSVPRGDDLPRLFQQYEFYRLELIIEKIEVSSDFTSAIAVSRLSHYFKPRGAREEQQAGRVKFTFQKKGDVWIIARMEKP